MIYGKTIVAFTIGVPSCIPFTANLTVILIILKHLHRIGFSVITEDYQFVHATIYANRYLLCIKDFKVVHMTAPRGGIGYRVMYSQIDIIGGINSECNRWNQRDDVSVFIATTNSQTRIFPYYCIFRHDCIIGTCFLGGLCRDDSKASVSTQFK